ncbi:MAG: hypothetical protein GY865_10090 [candidate division Zixibacteria bacterium]|nr:hypothetical protein [candidate division Zixibacteria bacterium]
MQKLATKNKNTDYPFDVWEKIEIVVEENGDSGIYMARISDFNNNGIVITTPEWIRGGRFMVSNAKVFVRFVKSDAMYQFPAHTKQIGKGAPDKLLLYGIGSIRRLQRREFVRIDYVTKMTFTIISKLNDENQEFKWFPSKTLNISAGGLLMNINDHVKEKDLLLLKINNYSVLNIPRFIVVHCRRLLTVDENKLAGVEFVTSDKLHKYFKPDELAKLPVQVKKFDVHSQNKLVRFVFEEQIEERKKGLL